MLGQQPASEQSPPEPAITPRRLRHDITEANEVPESADNALRNEPIESTEPKEPIEPIDANEPTLPIDRIEPFERMDRIEPSDL